MMGLSRIGVIAKQLIAGGLKQTTPVAVIQRGTTDDQKIVTGNLINIAKKIKDNKITPPSIIIIGNVVKLHKTIGWKK
jgi:uroporphyrin-III C-methyltransferase